jgi:MFS family permease
LLLFLLFGFNLSRGISSAAWLPWITALVPERVRGTYLARDAACVHIASCATLGLAALSLGHDPSAWRFAVVFGFSALTGAISLVFLRRIPDAEPPARDKVSRQPVPWLEISRYLPFRKLIVMNVAWALAYGGLGAFTVAYLKTEAGMSEAGILVVTGTAYLGGLAGLKYFEGHTDRLGSKPILAFCLWLWIGILAGWLLLAGRVVPPSLGVVLVLELLMGYAYGLVNMNNTRLAMLLAPPTGRNHFFALYSVAVNLTLGLAPVMWGLLIDAFGARHFAWPGMELNRFSLFFLLVLLVFIGTLLLTHRLDEPKARNVDELVRELLQTPHRLWFRIWPRGGN